MRKSSTPHSLLAAGLLIPSPASVPVSKVFVGHSRDKNFPTVTLPLLIQFGQFFDKHLVF